MTLQKPHKQCPAGRLLSIPLLLQTGQQGTLSETATRAGDAAVRLGSTRYLPSPLDN
jgi:hypothetical protein